MRIPKKYVIAVVVFSTTAYPLSYSADSPIQSQTGRQVGTIGAKKINEVSGIVASRKNKGVLWVHNDSGNPPNLYAINQEGELLCTYEIRGAENRDWEDIAIGPGPEKGVDYLYIGDIGDNFAKRKSVTVYRVEEPKVDLDEASDQEQRIGPAEEIELLYPDGPRDAETLLVDPLNGDIYVITKRQLFSRVYLAPYPQSTNEQTTMSWVAVLPMALVVGGDISYDGSLVVIKGLTNAVAWIRPKEEELRTIFGKDYVEINLIDEPQGEAICFDADAGGYFTVSEMKNPYIYYFTIQTE